MQAIATAYNSPKKRQLIGVQGLRGLAALLVVVAHLFEHGLGDDAPHVLLFGGRFGVIIFFVISGFVIHYASGDGPINPASFVIRRVARIVPLYWATTILVALLSVALPGLYKTTVLDTTALIKSLLFIPYEFPIGSFDWRPLFKLGWTLNYEMFFYFVMLCLFRCRSSRSRAIVLTIVMTLVVARHYLPRDPRSAVSFYASVMMVPFIGGVWVAEIWRVGVFTTHRVAHFAVPFALVVTVLLYAAPSSVTANGGTWPLVMSLPAVAMLVAALSIEREGRSMPFLLWLGDISFSMYLLHMFVVGALWSIAHQLSPAPTGTVSVVMIVSVGLAVTFLLSHLSFRWFEMPINRLGANFARRFEEVRR